MSIKEIVRSALINDNTLMNILNGPKVYALKAPDAEDYPRITFFEVSNSDVMSVDDRPYIERAVVQIDIWVKAGQGNPDDIVREVKRIMTNAGHFRVGGAEFYEEDTQVFHVALRYSILKEVE